MHALSWNILRDPWGTKQAGFGLLWAAGQILKTVGKSVQWPPSVCASRVCSSSELASITSSGTNGQTVPPALDDSGLIEMSSADDDNGKDLPPDIDDNGEDLPPDIGKDLPPDNGLIEMSMSSTDDSHFDMSRIDPRLLPSSSRTSAPPPLPQPSQPTSACQSPPPGLAVASLTPRPSTPVPFAPVIRNNGVAFVFPTDLYMSPVEEEETDDLQATSPPPPTPAPACAPLLSVINSSPTHSTVSEEWAELVNGIKKVPAKATITPQPTITEVSQNADKTAPRPRPQPRRKKKPSPPPAPEAAPVEPSGRSHRTRKETMSKEVVPLTVNTDGVVVRNAYGQPVDSSGTKRKKGKDNSTMPAKKAKRV
ncbi:hypothetical protein H0H92_003818 [Tricholoma furcatifolium]|nr:hypothetical protein H0H92_003818 [Tricholoma furcatifolium]